MTPAQRFANLKRFLTDENPLNSDFRRMAMGEVECDWKEDDGSLSEDGVRALTDRFFVATAFITDPDDQRVIEQCSVETADTVADLEACIDPDPEGYEDTGVLIVDMDSGREVTWEVKKEVVFSTNEADAPGKTSIDKHDVVRAVEDRLKDDPALLAQFKWLLKVWNTDDDRSFEEFDPTKPYGANYNPDEDDEWVEVDHPAVTDGRAEYDGERAADGLPPDRVIREEGENDD